MNALSGTIAERSQAALRAGCDVVLHCNGKLDEMTAVAEVTPELSGDAARVRMQRSRRVRRRRISTSKARG